jgi:response regulator RpfG family c-di-GMP phosphodiesterase
MVAVKNFDLVLLDIMMPEIDGFQVLSRMKADPSLRDIPVIMISALDEIKSVVRCIESGAEDFLSKPFDPVLLRARIGASLEKKRLRDEQKRRTTELEVAIDEAETQRRESGAARNILPATIADELRAGRGRAALLRECDDSVLRFRRLHARHRESGRRGPGDSSALLLHSVRPHCGALRAGEAEDDR